MCGVRRRLEAFDPCQNGDPSTVSSPTLNRTLKAIILPVALVLGGCGIVNLGGPDPQTVVNQRLLGTSVGDMFQRYGAAKGREEARDGSLTFTWESGALPMAAGPRGPEELICRLRIAADRNGRIGSALIVRDGQGLRQLSRCAELFSES